MELTDSKIESFNTTKVILEWEEFHLIDNELSQIHGVDPGKKSDGIVRVIMEHLNGFNSRLSGNNKLNKTKDLADDLEADILVYTEHRLNIKHKDN